MGVVIHLARSLRIDRGTWRWLDSDASLRGSAAMVAGAYVVLAFDRFGWPDFALRATTRMVLIGFYGWIWLAAASWVAVRLWAGTRPSLADHVRLTGHAHLPMLVVGLLVWVFSVMMNIGGIWQWPALFAGSFWMPAMIVNAVAAASGLSLRRAALPGLVPYAVWAAAVGRYLWLQVAHLL